MHAFAMSMEIAEVDRDGGMKIEDCAGRMNSQAGCPLRTRGGRGRAKVETALAGHTFSLGSDHGKGKEKKENISKNRKKRLEFNAGLAQRIG